MCTPEARGVIFDELHSTAHLLGIPMDESSMSLFLPDALNTYGSRCYDP